MTGRLVRALRVLAPPVLAGALMLAVWQATVVYGRVAAYVLPAPSVIATQFWADRDIVWKVSLASGANALVGLIAGALAGVVAALVASRLQLLAEASMPLVAALNALPIIALAPILNNMFATTSSVPRRLVVAVIVFFPVFLNTWRGLREVNPVHQELMESYAAGGWIFARKVRLPGALPFFFTGLRQAASLAVIAAVVSEYFGGLQDGLGSRITSAAAVTAYASAWAYVIGACTLGLLFFVTVLGLERLATPWRASQTH
jgi:NitT/TauT family transport system permease protein